VSFIGVGKLYVVFMEEDGDSDFRSRRRGIRQLGVNMCTLHIKLSKVLTERVAKLICCADSCSFPRPTSRLQQGLFEFASRHERKLCGIVGNGGKTLIGLTDSN
jgi:hypothetical protein